MTDTNVGRIAAVSVEPRAGLGSEPLVRSSAVTIAADVALIPRAVLPG
jgi:predicted anti-sigma-YlaC factor YlaD